MMLFKFCLSVIIFHLWLIYLFMMWKLKLKFGISFWTWILWLNLTWKPTQLDLELYLIIYTLDSLWTSTIRTWSHIWCKEKHFGWHQVLINVVCPHINVCVGITCVKFPLLYCQDWINCLCYNVGLFFLFFNLLIHNL